MIPNRVLHIVINTLSIMWLFYFLPSSSYFARRRWWHPTPVLLPRKSHGWWTVPGNLGGVRGFLLGKRDTTAFAQTHSTCCVATHNPPPMHLFCALCLRTPQTFLPHESKLQESEQHARSSQLHESQGSLGSQWWAHQTSCGISPAAPQAGPDECLPATFLPLSLTALHGDFLQHVRQRLPVW